MFWKKENNADKKINQLNETLKKSFGNVKKDTSNIFQWLNYFYRKSIEQEQRLKQHQLELSYMPKTREEIRQIIDSYYSFESIMGKIRELSAKIDELAQKQIKPEYEVQTMQNVQQMGISRIEKRLEKLEERRHLMKEQIIKRLTRNSKEYVKGVIMSYIRKYERISAFQLKEMVVDEQQLCSRSSFYRLLEEIEALEDIGIIKQGKEKHYILKVAKRI